MTREEFLRVLKTAGIRYSEDEFTDGGAGGEYIYVDDVLVLSGACAFIEPDEKPSYFMTTCNETMLKDVTKKDIAKFVTYWRKFHKYDIMNIVRRIKYDRPLCGLRYTTISGKRLDGEAAVKALKRDLRNGIKRMENNTRG